jgi:hypothetical protein
MLELIGTDFETWIKQVTCEPDAKVTGRSYTIRSDDLAVASTSTLDVMVLRPQVPRSCRRMLVGL